MGFSSLADGEIPERLITSEWQLLGRNSRVRTVLWTVKLDIELSNAVAVAHLDIIVGHHSAEIASTRRYGVPERQMQDETSKMSLSHQPRRATNTRYHYEER
jgi:hypothetical protein